MQGASLEVVLSAGAQLHRLEAVHLETQLESDWGELGAVPIYRFGGATFDAMESRMVDLGYHLIACAVQNCALSEFDCLFESAVLGQRSFDGPYVGVPNSFVARRIGDRLGRLLDGWAEALDKPSWCPSKSNIEAMYGEQMKLKFEDEQTPLRELLADYVQSEIAHVACLEWVRSL